MQQPFSAGVQVHDPDELIGLFNGLFQNRWRTVLVRGDSEPLYLPRDETCFCDRLIFANGYFSSALHEIAHWTIAGKRRRRLPDFGYWYRPDGRDLCQQREFERVEVKPQAIEWAFSAACNLRFHFSADNLNGEPSDDTAFKQSVLSQLHHYLRVGFPRRAAMMLSALAERFGTQASLTPARFILEEPRHPDPLWEARRRPGRPGHP